jgi:hypothetical protein
LSPRPKPIRQIARRRFLVSSVLESQRHPDLNSTENDFLRNTREFLTGATNDAINRGELGADTNAMSLAELLLAVLCGVGFYAGFVGSGRQLEVITDQLQQLLAGAPR